MPNATENYATFESSGADGEEYGIILDKDGNRVVDPITEDNYGYSAVMSGDFVLTASEIINCKTGERKTHTFDSVGLLNDRVMVKVNDAYYFIDPADPDTLINPFEIVDKIYTVE